MSQRRPYIGPSESEINAQALMRRGAPFTAASEATFRVQFDFHYRQPENAREAAYMLRKAYADEVPTKIHEGPDSIGPDGTPKMTARAEGYIFGAEEGSDAQRDPVTRELPFFSYYHSPFRASLSLLERGSFSERKRAAIVSHVVLGKQAPPEAAIAEGVPAWIAKDVAELVLIAFHRGMSDMKIHARPVAKDESAA